MARVLQREIDEVLEEQNEIEEIAMQEEEDFYRDEYLDWKNKKEMSVDDKFCVY